MILAGESVSWLTGARIRLYAIAVVWQRPAFDNLAYDPGYVRPCMPLVKAGNTACTVHHPYSSRGLSLWNSTSLQGGRARSSLHGGKLDGQGMGGM